jgi:hypothetical protein
LLLGLDDVEGYIKLFLHLNSLGKNVSFQELGKCTLLCSATLQNVFEWILLLEITSWGLIISDFAYSFELLLAFFQG